MHGTSVYLSILEDSEPQTSKPVIPSITDLGDFEFRDKIIKVWRYFGIGPGRILEETLLKNKENRGSLKIVEQGGATSNYAQLQEQGFDQIPYFWVTSSYMVESKPGEEPPDNVFDKIDHEDPESAPSGDENHIYEDDNESCSAAFSSFGALIRHVQKGKHVKSLQMYKVEDYALATYLGKIEEIDRSRAIPIIIEDLKAANEIPLESPPVTMGWAHEQARENKRHTDDAKAFLEEIFEKGRISKSKVDPKKSMELMKNAVLDDGSMRFRVEDRLSERQIASYFSRLAAEMRKKLSDPKRKRSPTEGIDVNEMILAEEGDPYLEYRYNPMFPDEFETLLEM